MQTSRFSPKVYFVLVNYMGEKDTIECIDSINTKTNYDKYGIIVVDNSPGIESYEKLKEEKLDKTILVRSKKNNGFAAACNIGIKVAEKLGYDYIILLNNDTIIKSPNLIKELQKGFKKYGNVGIVGGKIYYFDNPDEIWYAAGYLSCVRLRARNRSKIKGIVETPFITGCLMMISREAIRKVGMLTEDYFMCYEDADYCERMHQCGYRTVYNSKAQIFHKVSKSAPSSSVSSIYNSNRARFLYMNRYHKKIFVVLVYFAELYIKKILYKGEKNNAIKKVLKNIINHDLFDR